jgi:Carbamoyl-phosphate synthase L chain, ATP binding domain
LKPTVLVVTTSRWFPTARLVVALANAGCIVQAVCPSNHPISQTKVIDRLFTYRGLSPLKSISAAISASDPALLVSGDDLATSHLHALHAQQLRATKPGAVISQLIERSLGAPEFFSVIDDRAAFMQISKEEGVLIPQTAVIANAQDLDQWIAQTGFPFVLKANGTSGGVGVRVVRNPAEAHQALRTLQAPPLLARALKRALFDRDATLISPSFRRTRSAVTAQSFIAGTEATTALACWKGQVLASLHFQVLQKTHAAGHATVLRRIDHLQMSAAVEKLVRRLQLSGLHGFDFMLDANSQHAYLIEINPRATQVGHLSFGAGHDLPAALVAALSNMPPHPAPKVTDHDTIALFPQEQLRDSSSTYLQSAYHDVPVNQPALLRACLQRPRDGIVQKLIQRFTGKK